MDRTTRRGAIHLFRRSLNHRYSSSYARTHERYREDLGLSVVTISKVSNHPDIAENTRERVLQRIKELDYRPNTLARSLVTGRSYLMRLVVPDLLIPSSLNWQRRSRQPLENAAIQPSSPPLKRVLSWKPEKSTGLWIAGLTR